MDGGYPQVPRGPVGAAPATAHTDGMNQIQLTPATFDHLTALLRRTCDPSPPTLPPGSRTAAALHRAGLAWTGTHRRADEALRGHVREVRDVLSRVREADSRFAAGLEV
jgi:hypothetical protein